jgi:beta-lactamase superfamily II metal-dependent hydrolase
MGIRFEFFEAGCGDSIWITTDEGVNILIDGGFSSTYRDKIKPKIEELRANNKKLDLVVLTHYDVDHIGGISKLIEEESKYKSDTIIKEIWFNAFEDVTFPIKDDKEDNFSPINQLKHNKTGAKQQKKFEKFIADIKPYVEYRNLIDLMSIDKITKPIEKENMVLLSPYTDRAYKSNKDIKITLLSPNNKKLNLCQRLDYEKKKTGNKKRDWDKNFRELLEDEILYKENHPNPQDFLDTSKANGTSIAFILEYKGKKYLFLGDAHIDLVVDSLNKLYTPDEPLVVDFVKLSHHGSIRNINKDFLSLIRTNQFVILANGNKSHWHPDKETLVMIIDYYRDYSKKISFIFNHELQSIFKDAFPLFKDNELKENNINKDSFEFHYKRFL